MKRKQNSKQIYFVIFLCIAIFLTILYFVYNAYMDAMKEIAATTPLNTGEPRGVNAPTLTEKTLTMQNDVNYNAVVNSYSNYTLPGERKNAIAIVNNQMRKLYANAVTPNPEYLLDQQLYNLLKSTTISQFESYIGNYYPAFTESNEIMNFYNDGNYQAVVVPFSGDKFNNKLYGDARNAAIIMTAVQIGKVFPSTGPFDTSGLNDRQLYNLLKANSFKEYQKLIKSYYPDRKNLS